jgi:hypothetical protein
VKLFYRFPLLLGGHARVFVPAGRFSVSGRLFYCCHFDLLRIGEMITPQSNLSLPKHRFYDGGRFVLIAIMLAVGVTTISLSGANWAQAEHRSADAHHS